MTMSMTMSLSSPDSTQDKAQLPRLNINSPATMPPNPKKNLFLTEEERAVFIVASSTRRPSIQSHFQSPTLSSPPSASFINSSSSAASCTSTASSPGEFNSHLSFSNPTTPGGSAISPILTPFQWTSDLRQYIMTDIGPQPSNSQMPTLRSHSHLVRQRSCSKISPVCIVNNGHGPNNSGSVSAGVIGKTTVGGLETNKTAPCVRRTSVTDLCTIPQDEILPPMDVPLEKRFAHDEWDDEDE
ncbi:hypothetical protein BG011_006307 [Mortierella polycephala]|uniref:Uncharacterized protein n=1 Tax=Mortierella polycephala TaxID=41804 RepID=A0A9P6PWG8_9FUNG|nr:hypothetical protein BG011_006307 [Mortierella polycephala]